MHYYVKIDPAQSNRVNACSALTGPISATNWHQVTEAQYEMVSAGGMWSYNPATGEMA